MDNELRQQIYTELSLRETEDLLEIWQDNDRIEWSDDAFEIIAEILKARGIDIAQLDREGHEINEIEDYLFNDEELRIIDDENPPDFYDPFEVLNLSRWNDLAIKAMIGLIIVHNLLNISSSWRIAQSYFVGSKYLLGAYLVTILIVVANMVLGILLIYMPLKALSQILRILMEMEFKSRKAS